MSDFFSEATSAFFKPIASYLDDPEVTEVMVNGTDRIYVEKKGKIYKTKSSFDDTEQLMAAVRRLAQSVGRTIDEKMPMMDARMQDGSRVHAMIPPCARGGIYLAIRKFAKEMMSLKQLVDGESLSLPMAKFLNLCVSLAKNIVVSGGTSSGKTTLLNIVSTLIPPKERIIVIEDASELQLQQDHVLPMETKPADKKGQGEVRIRDLLRASLRMRPDRIVIGEVRGGEALDLIQAMNTGHSGSMTTLHANSPRDALSRAETLALMSDVEIPLLSVRSQIASAVDIVIQAARLRDGSRKITHISEVMELTENGQYQIQDLFRYEIQSVSEKGEIHGKHIATGNLPTFLEDAKTQGYTVDETLFKKG